MTDPGASGRLDAVLVARRLARSRQRAVEAIRAGLVLLDGRPVRKPAHHVAPGSKIVVESDEQSPYVSRGALKLIGALERLGVRVTGRCCIDAGASTGGFTQVLLERGARRVVAVDVGTGQLAAALREDPRVVDLQRTHLASLRPEEIGGPADLLVADLSFISLLPVLGVLADLTAPDGELLPMVKPQFEVGRHRLGPGGVVRDRELHREVVLAVAEAAEQHGLRAHGIVPSPAPGAAGNVEYFVLLRRSRPERSPADLWREMGTPS